MQLTRDALQVHPASIASRGGHASQQPDSSRSNFQTTRPSIPNHHSLINHLKAGLPHGLHRLFGRFAGEFRLNPPERTKPSATSPLSVGQRDGLRVARIAEAQILTRKDGLSATVRHDAQGTSLNGDGRG
jgi:hypothetical protein